MKAFTKFYCNDDFKKLNQFFEKKTNQKIKLRKIQIELIFAHVIKNYKFVCWKNYFRQDFYKQIFNF